MTLPSTLATSSMDESIGLLRDYTNEPLQCVYLLTLADMRLRSDSSRKSVDGAGTAPEIRGREHEYRVP